MLRVSTGSVTGRCPRLTEAEYSRIIALVKMTPPG